MKRHFLKSWGRGNFCRAKHSAFFENPRSAWISKMASWRAVLDSSNRKYQSYFGEKQTNDQRIDFNFVKDRRLFLRFKYHIYNTAFTNDSDIQLSHFYVQLKLYYKTCHFITQQIDLNYLSFTGSALNLQHSNFYFTENLPNKNEHAVSKW